MPTTDPTKRREISKRYYDNNKEKALAATRKWQDEHQSKCKENKKIWKAENPDKVKAQYKKWVDKDPIRTKELFRGYAKKRRKTIIGGLSSRISPYISRSLRDGKSGRSWESIVGYTVIDLKSHLEKQFKDGMSWENRSSWHIDHIIPISAFNYETVNDIDFKKCWDINNLQPMWAKKNISKKDKVSIPFQPSLLISGE
jgi:hypothetical protein